MFEQVHCKIIKWKPNFPLSVVENGFSLEVVQPCVRSVASHLNSSQVCVGVTEEQRLE